jgi:uncharacterized protein (DUF433 family)
MLTLEQQAPPLQIDNDGTMRVGGTRIPLETVVRAFNQGHTAEEIASHYPALKLADVYAVIAYYLNHPQPVHQYLQAQAQAAEQVWERIEATTDYQLFRERLQARRAALVPSEL